MPNPTLTECRSPWVVVTRADDPWVTAEAGALRDQGGMIVRMAGAELRDPASLFTAFARELSFPGYFGRNWDALVDCLHDWHGHETAGQGLAVLIDDADHLAHADFLGVFISVLCQAGWKANLQLDADGIPHEDWPPFSLHFVLLATEPTAFADGAASGMDVSVTLADGRLVATLTGADWPGSDPQES
ncbi:barstar family protein [Actinoplanes hulinensis]|uniref:Barstar family protein n=1 Tax=Actinoplanes hulinensis TaxID=1144547 RepID=A0ABS7BEK0_9ACTN|nr:barstar family protein [Actinoplanes hulinensis]MBW6439298.1 barstar family protein [Actinoplanes hulinensis]